jgi:hypothetical protein
MTKRRRSRRSTDRSREGGPLQRLQQPLDLRRHSRRRRGGVRRDPAHQDARKNLAVPFVLLLPDGTIAGCYTLSATSVRLAELPTQTVRKLPRCPRPATLLGPLAVDRRQQGKGYGRFLLADASTVNRR